MKNGLLGVLISALTATEFAIPIGALGHAHMSIHDDVMPACSNENGDNLLMPKYLDDPTRTYRGHGAAKKLHCVIPSCISSPCQPFEECTETKSGFVCTTADNVAPQPQENQKDLRIIGERSQREGLVEIRHNGNWLKISSRGWDIYSAAVVCRSLGFFDAVRAFANPGTAAPGAKGPLPNMMIRLNCEGDERDFRECKAMLVESNGQPMLPASIVCGGTAAPCENGGSFFPRHPIGHFASKPCACAPGFTGPLCEWATSCKVLFDAGYNRTDIYTIKPGKGNAFPVECDMETDGGGWTVIMRASSSNELFQFNPSFHNYQEGFLKPPGDHWIGLDRILELGPFPVSLRLDFGVHGANLSGLFAYYDFYLADADQGYRADFGSFNGTTGDPLKERASCSLSGRTFTLNNRQGWWFGKSGCERNYFLTGCMSSSRCHGLVSLWLGSDGRNLHLTSGEMRMRPIRHVRSRPDE